MSDVPVYAVVNLHITDAAPRTGRTILFTFPSEAQA